GALAVDGRNGMGKTTLCNAFMGLVPTARGSIHAGGVRIHGLEPNRVVAHGLAYVPQGRRVWASLSVDEHLRLAARMRKAGSGEARGGEAAWDVERIYDTFPRLKERRRNGGAQLSGGEQQMLAIGRALMTNPRLLILDEATEGLAPIIREEIWACIGRLKAEGEAILVIDKNVSALLDLADRHYVVEKGRVVWQGDTAAFRADAGVIDRYLHV
ncbi:MAG: ABC transporter ATP-binding protein, partial [Thalassobaculum sp.]|uniref:ABC transporter ATP-binding protein n=1 Tax=Thalassobaculum sp. TaxID=2022740 RepID=UPI0032EB03BC